MRLASRSSLLASFVLGIAGLQPFAAHAQNTFFPTNTTLNSSNPVQGNAIVGYANQNNFSHGTNPTSPTVRLVSGGSVSGFLEADNSSSINISGGSVDSVYANNNSTVNITGGNMSVVDASNNSTVNVTGGSVSAYLEADNNSTINLRGGSVGSYLVVYDSSTLNIFGTNLTATFNYLDSNNFIVYSLSGILSDGTVLVGEELDVQQRSNPHVILNNAAVPEPGNVALLVGLTTTGAGFLSRRRKSVHKAA